MIFKPAVWYPIAVALSVLNLLGIGFAAGQAEPWHAVVHGGLTVAFGFWAQRLRQAPPGDLQAGLEALEFEVSKMRQELSETQERLDFTERMLAQGPEARRVGPQP